jgi:hypothetical protein
MALSSRQVRECVSGKIRDINASISATQASLRSATTELRAEVRKQRLRKAALMNVLSANFPPRPRVDSKSEADAAAVQKAAYAAAMDAVKIDAVLLALGDVPECDDLIKDIQGGVSRQQKRKGKGAPSGTVKKRKVTPLPDSAAQ